MRLVIRDERGSIPLFLGVMLVATALITATVVTVDADLKSSRRAGDSANALQVADAGVNDAIQEAPKVPRTQGSFTRTVNLGNNGTYTYTATRDPIRKDVWHIDSVGTDRSLPQQVKRRIKADAVPTSLFNSPIFVNNSLNLSSGISLDSFNNGATASAMCTRKGVIATNDPAGMSFGSQGQGAGVTNCLKRLNLDSTWDYAMDGCTSWGDGSQALPPIGTGKCPPAPYTFRTPPKKFSPAAVSAPPPATTDYSGATLICDPKATPSALGKTDPNAKHTVTSLQGGKTYYYTTSVTLLDGCRVTDPVLVNGAGVDIDRAVTIYSGSKVMIGNPVGQGGSINRPPNPALPAENSVAVCGAATANSAQKDGTNLPAYYYCPLWSGGLRIRVLTAANDGEVEIRRSGTQFWGSIEVPSGKVTLSGSQIEVWGAAVSNTGTSAAQFTWHFDDALSNISAGQYAEATWYEVGV